MAIQAGNMFTWDWSKLTAYVRTVIGPTELEPTTTLFIFSIFLKQFYENY